MSACAPFAASWSSASRPAPACPATISGSSNGWSRTRPSSLAICRARSGCDFLASPGAVVGRDHRRAVSGGGVALCGGRVDRHDDRHRYAERLTRRRKALREIAGGIGDHAAFCFVGGQLLQPPIGAANLERTRPLQRFRLDENAGRAGLARERRGFDQRRHLGGLGGDGVSPLQMVEGWHHELTFHSPLGNCLLSSSTLRSMWLRM